MPRGWLVALIVVAALVAGACGERSQAGAERVVVGVGSTDEQRVLAALTALALDRAGFEPELRTDLGGTVGLRREALGGGIDIFWDYTGAAWALGMGQQAPPADPEESYARVRSADEDTGLSWLPPSAANATLALFVRDGDQSEAAEPPRLSWLAGLLSSGRARLCADGDFLRRRGGMDALAAAYGMDAERVLGAAVPASEATAIRGASEERCFAALATATSGEARRAGLVRVVDDRQVFPAFVVAPVARRDRLEAIEGLSDALDPVVAVLDTDALARMNARAVAGERPDGIAADVLGPLLPNRR